jgi:hypothetical protein
MFRTTTGRSGGRLTAAILAGALALTACGDDAAPDEEGPAASDEAGQAEDETGDGEGADADEDASGEAAPPAAQLTAEDGWNGVQALDIPDAGRGVLQVAGETIELDVICDASGPLDDHGYLLFWFQATGTGEDSQGRQVRASVSRQILDVEEASKTVYDYRGQEAGSIQITVDIGDGMAHSSIIVSPGDDDSAGNELPIVHVDETGAYTVVQDVPPFAVNHDQALSGPVELAGRCQDTWPDDASI